MRLSRSLRFLFSVYFALILHFGVMSQRIVETQWFFGQSEFNIQFDKNGVLSYEEERMNPVFGTGGPAVISNPETGNLLFYTDGERIYDASHQAMQGSSPLNGNSVINQAAVACKIPGSLTRYLVFTNSGSSGVNEIQYSEIDMGQTGTGNGFEPHGQVTSVNNPTGLVDPSEAMIIIESSEDNTLWLITQNSQTLDFHASIINNFGLGGGTVANLDTTAEYPGAEASQFAYDPVNRVLAVAPKDPNRNIVLLNFNDTTGVFEFNSTIRNSGYNDGAGESVYDLEWSRDGRVLYFSRFGSADSTVANLYSYDFDGGLPQPILNNNIYRSLGIRRGIDNNLYHLYQANLGGSYQVGLLEDLDSGLVSTYTPAYFDADFNGTQFPSFGPVDYAFTFDNLTFKAIDSCASSPTFFFPEVSPTPNNYFWSFGDGNFSNGVAPIHTYEDAGNYQVTLTVELNNIIASFTQPIQVLANDLMVDLGADTTICENETLELDAGDGIIYQWSTGETTQTIEVDTSGVYWVSVSDGRCSAYDAIEVSEYGVQNNIGNQWYFGEMAGLDFNTQPPTPLTDPNQMFSPEGCATISGVDGSLLFYTNGSTVWNKDHEVMEIIDPFPQPDLAPNQIGGDSTVSQGVLILPFMDDETMFYIFTAEEVYSENTYDIRYSIVDIKEDSARGAVVLRNLPFFETSIERVTSSGFENSAWLVTHEHGNNSFRSNFVDANGIGPTIYSPVGEVLKGTESIEGSGTMKFDPAIQNFATITPGVNNLEIFNFVDSTGRMSDPVLVETGELNTYGLEWSPGGNKIYISTDSKLIQFDLDSLQSENAGTEILATKYDGYQTGSGYGTIQTGPDGEIYIAVDGQSTLYTIINPDGDGANSSLNTTGQTLAGRISRLGLPNFAQQSSSNETQPGLVFDPGCLGVESEFTASGTSPIDEYFWTFDSTAENLTDVGQVVTNLFNEIGPHPFELNITNRCGYDTIFFDTLNVFTIPESPEIPSETNLCAENLVLEAWFEDDPSLNYYWSTGDTSRVIQINEPAIIEVAIYNDEGCSSDTSEIFAGDNRPFLELGNDLLLCQNERGVILDANTTGVTYEWAIDGTDSGSDTSRFQPVQTSVPGEYEYTLTIEESFFGCRNTDTVNVIVNQSPALDTEIMSPSSCGMTDASIEFDVTSSGSYNYSLSGVGITERNFIDGPGNSPLYDNLAPGNYQLTLEDIVTGCVTFDPVTIQDDALFDVSATNLPDCGIEANVQISLVGATLPSLVNVYVSTLAGDTILREENLLTPIQSFPTLDNGIYYVNIRDVETNCTRSDTVLIEPFIVGEPDCDPLILAPNAFSPNGNGYNEEFYIIPNPFIDNFEIFIYSKWGEVVFYSQSQTFRWDGNYRNEVLGPGTFAYIIKYQSREEPERGTLTQYGSVTILK